MCSDSDLFGDVIVTLDDVELWLNEVPKNLSHLSNSRLLYAKNYDVANKIKRAKLNGTFYDLGKSDKTAHHSAKFLYHPDYLRLLSATSLNIFLQSQARN